MMMGNRSVKVKLKKGEVTLTRSKHTLAKRQQNAHRRCDNQQPEKSDSRNRHYGFMIFYDIP
jgi:hypothetical protein